MGTMVGRPCAHWNGRQHSDSLRTKVSHFSLPSASPNLMAPLTDMVIKSIVAWHKCYAYASVWLCNVALTLLVIQLLSLRHIFIKYFEEVAIFEKEFMRTGKIL